MHHQRGIGILSVSFIEAHSVGHNAALLARRGNNYAAGAHAKGEYRPFVRVGNELIVRGRKIFKAFAVLRKPDFRGEMFNSHADGEIPRLHFKPAIIKLLESVPCRVPYRGDRTVRAQLLFFARTRIFEYQRIECATSFGQPDKPCVEHIRSAVRFNVRADIFQNPE